MTANQPHTPIETLLAEREWVRALARRLVADVNEADDLEQQTWLATARHPPGDLSSPRAWLGTVLRHIVHRNARDEGRRHVRELAAARPEATSSSADLVARAEAHRRVVEAVMALAEPYRSTVLARYFDDLPPREIAQQMGVPVETVRTRIKRGLAELRARLDAEYGGDGKAWGIALLPLAWKGGVIVKGTTKAAIAAGLFLALAGGTWWVMGARTAPAAPIPPVETASTRAPVPSKAPATSTSTTATAPAKGAASIVGEAWFASPEAAAVGVEVKAGDDADSRAVRTGSDGKFVIDSLPKGFRGSVRIAAERFAPVVRPLMPLREGERRDIGLVRLAAPCGATVAVLTFDAEAVEGAVVEARRTPEPTLIDWRIVAADWRDDPTPEASVVTGKDGRATFASLEPSVWTFVVNKTGFSTNQVRSIELAPGARRDDLKAYLGRACALTGRVHDRDGHGMVGLRVSADGGWYNASYQAALLPHVVTGADGAFTIDGLLPAAYVVRVAPPEGAPVRAAKVRVPTSSPLDVLVDPCRIAGVVREGPELKPSEGAFVRVYDSEVTAEARTDADGRYELTVLVPKNSVSTPKASKPGWAECDPVETPKGYQANRVDPGWPMTAGRVRRSDFVLVRGAAVAGRATCEGVPVRGATVQVTTRRAGSFGAVTDGDGRYSLEGLPAGPVLVSATAPGLAFKVDQRQDFMRFNGGADVPGTLQLEAGADSVRDLEFEHGVTVSGHVTLPGGAPAAGATIPSLWGASALADADGRFRLEVSPTQSQIWISVAYPGFLRDGQFVRVPDGRREMDVEIELKPAPRVRGRVDASTSTRLHGAWVQVTTSVDLDRLGWQGSGWPLVPREPVAQDGSFDVALSTSSGDVLVRGGADGLASGTVKATPTDESATAFAATVRLDALARIAGRAVLDESGAPVAGAAVLLDAESRGWQYPSGKPTIDVVAATTDADGRFSIEDVSAGRHAVEVVTDGRLPARMTIEAGGAAETEFRLPPMHAISGVVVFADGTPLVRASVEAILDVEAGRNTPTLSVASTAEDGTFVVGYLPEEGPFKVRVTDGLSFAGIERVELRGVAADAKDLRITVRAASALRGRVVAPDGAPVGGAVVDAFSENGRGGGSATSREDGTFEMLGVQDGVCEVVARPPPATRFADYGVDLGMRWLGVRVKGVRPPADGLVLALVEGNHVAGVALDAKGQPLRRRFICANRLGTEEELRARGLLDVVVGYSTRPACETDDEGRFDIGGLPPGEFQLVALGSAPNIEKFPLVGAERVAAGTTDVRATIGAFASVAGVVLDDRGAPVAAASVLAVAADGRRFSASSERDGSFLVKGLDAGAFVDVHARAEGRAPARADHVAAGATSVRMQLGAGLTATGRVLDANGKPVAATILVMATDASALHVTAKTDAEGRFRATGLLAARYSVFYTAMRDGRVGPIACGEIDAGATDIELRSK